MAIVGIRELNKDTKGVIERLVETREPVILTKQGTPIATIMPIDQRRLNDLVIATAPELVETLESAERQFAAGETKPLAEVMAERRKRRASGGGAAPAVEAETAERQEAAHAPGPSPASFFKQALAERARRLSREIVEESTKSGALTVGEDESLEGELVERIAESNARLLEAALGAARIAAVEARVQEASGAGEPEHAILEKGEMTRVAEDQVVRVNERLIQGGKGRISVHDLARELRDVAEPMSFEGGPELFA